MELDEVPDLLIILMGIIELLVVGAALISFFYCLSQERYYAAAIAGTIAIFLFLKWMVF